MNASFPDLKGASVYITGGGSGIGAALTDAFMAQGSHVAFIGRSDATDFCDAMEAKHGTRPLFMQGDITDTARLKATMDEAAAAHGPITTLVNNAANDKRHSTEEVTEDFWNWMIDINLKAYFFACKHAAPMMAQAGGGSIINFSSISYMMGNAGYPIYTTANAGINGMTRSLAREFGPDKIRVNALAPGWVLTQKQKDMWVTEEGLAAHLERQCLKDPLAPDDIAGGVLFLASDASKMMTGQALVIDGGVVVTG
ncbi:SDR family NAD(P)-dependent oxidoreductase [Nereida sp. MMG025]|uniref:SDR family NAD(P)-dependent oxidoreductase n=1 Tax=Nereida sp. MMG025 TaxID=2909981 RepID=UPI001F3D906B|nr:SDR family oxidoreductase [Nereida sp. MMG025]MCF6445805.1 SDR family oxidoreductase [Nereida sp. MMG025]